MIEDVEIQIVEYNSVLQEKSVELRYKVLREPLGLVYTPEQLASEWDEIHIVAIKEEEVIGAMVLKKEDNACLKMRQVAVDSSQQRTGIGKKLVRFSELYAQQHHYKRMELHARENAKDFYLSLNYLIVGDRFTEVGIPHFKMKKLF